MTSFCHTTENHYNDGKRFRSQSIIIIASLTTYYYLLDFGLSSATSRFGAAALAAGDEEQLNDVLSTVMLLFVCMGVLVVVASGAVAWSVQYFLDDPAEINLICTIILVQGIGLGIGFSSKAFGGVTIIHLRYDLLEINSLNRLFLETVAIFYFLSHRHGGFQHAWTQPKTQQQKIILEIM